MAQPQPPSRRSGAAYESPMPDTTRHEFDFEGRGRKLYVSASSLSLITPVWHIRDSDNKTKLFKAKLHERRKPYLELLDSARTSAGFAVFGGDVHERSTTIGIGSDKFIMRFDEDGPGSLAGKPSVYWPSPAFGGTILEWRLEMEPGMRHVACVEGDVTRPVAVVRETMHVFSNAVGEVQVFDEWPADHLAEIVLLAVTELRRWRYLFTSPFTSN